MRKAPFGIIVLGLITLLTSGAAATTVLGQVAANEVYIDGVSAATGTTIVSPSTVQTRDEQAIIQLSAGARLYLGPNSTAQLAASESGDVQVFAGTGVVQIADMQGEVMSLASNSMAVVDQQGDAELDPDQRVCVLDSPGQNTSEACSADHSLKGCDWDESTAGELQPGDVYFVPASDDDDCDKGIAAWVWAAGGAAAVALAIELNEDDDEAVDAPPVSPFQP